MKRLLKMDAETHGPEVPEGCGTLLRDDRPILLIEPLNEDVPGRAAERQEDPGHEFHDIDDVTWSPRRVPSLGRSGHFNFLVCQPGVARSIGL